MKMKYTITAILFILIYGCSHGQSFEGKVVYKVQFQANKAKLGEMVMSKMKQDGEFYDEIVYYFKEGNYCRENNSKKKKRIIYKSEENKLYYFEDSSEFVTIVNGENTSFLSSYEGGPTVKLTKLDSIKVIKNDSCKLVKLSWESFNDEYYWYHPSRIKIDSELFQKHNSEYLNKILQLTNAFPMEITKSIGKLMAITMTVETIEEMKVDDELFAIPELRNPKRKKDRYQGKISGNTIMEIKN